MVGVVAIIGFVAAGLLTVGLWAALWRVSTAVDLNSADFSGARPRAALLLSLLVGFGAQALAVLGLAGGLGAIGMPGRAPAMLSVSTVPMFAVVLGAVALAFYKKWGGERNRTLVVTAVLSNAALYGVLLLGAIRSAYNARLLPEDLYKKLWGMGLMPATAKMGITFLFFLMQAFLTWFAALLTVHIPLKPVRGGTKAADGLPAAPRLWGVLPQTLLLGLPLGFVGFMAAHVLDHSVDEASYLANLRHAAAGLWIAAASAAAGPLAVVGAAPHVGHAGWHWRAFFAGASGMCYLWAASLFGRKPEDAETGKFMLARAAITGARFCIWVPACGFIGLLAALLFVRRRFPARETEFDLDDEGLLEEEV